MITHKLKDFTHTHTYADAQFTDSFYRVQDENTCQIILHHKPEWQIMDVKPLAYL
jgi:hypothetical protein